MNRKSRKGSLFLAALGVSFVIPAAFGQTVNWTGADSNIWTDPNNWNPNGVPGSSSIADFTSSAGSGGANITLGGTTQTVGAIEFDGSPDPFDLGTTAGDAFTISDANISSSIGAIAVTSSVGNPQEIDANLSFSSSSSLITQGSVNAGLTFGSTPGSATLGLATAGASSGLTFTFTGSGTITVNDAITSVGGSTVYGSAGVVGSASGGLQFKAAASTGGMIILNAQSTYSGITNLNNGNGSVSMMIGSSTDTDNAATFTKGPFGVSTIVPNSGTQTPFVAYGADQTVANPINAVTGFTVADAATINSSLTSHNLTLSGPIAYSSLQSTGRTFTFNNYGQTCTLGAADNPSTITFDTTASSGSGLNLAFNPSNNGTAPATLVINDVIQDNGTPTIPDTVSFNSNGNNTPMGIVQLNGASTYAGKTTVNGQTSGTVVGLTVQVGVSSVGAGSLVTSGPFGRGTLIWNGNSNGPGFLEPFGADRTVGNNITMTSGFIVLEPSAFQDPTVSTAPHNLTLTGNITDTASKILTNDLPAGVALTLGSAASPATIALNSSAGAAGFVVQSQSGTTGPNGGVTVINDILQNSGSVPGAITVQNGGTVELMSSNTYTGGTNVKNNALVTTATNFTNGTLSLSVGTLGGGFATVVAQPTPGATAGVSVVPALNMDNGTTNFSSKLDLTNNGMIVQSATSLSTIQADIVRGAASGFTGPGITSSLAAAVAADSGNTHKTAIGYASVSELGNPSTFLGVPITDSNSTLVRYTLAGDSNLDGVVNALDFNALATHFGTTSGADWSQGDYNYDGSVDSNDFDLLAANYNGNIATAATSSMPADALGSVVPEPTTMGLVGLSLLALRRRRGK